MVMVKKFCVLSFFILHLVLLHAQQVSRDEALTAAQNFIISKRSNLLDNSVLVDTLLTKDTNNATLFYEVCFNNGFSVLVSGHKQCTPILGYFFHKKGPADEEWIDPIEQLPPAYIQLLDYYTTTLDSLFKNAMNGLDEHPGWFQLSVVDTGIIYRTIIVDTLISSKWGQDKSNDLYKPDKHAYSYYVYNINNCNNAPAGCVAVAMGQILNYWSRNGYYIDNPVYCWEYDWDNMPDCLFYQNGNNNLYENQRNAIAALLRDCGISVNMIYSNNFSSIHRDSLSAICRSFEKYGFSSQLEQKSDYILTTWENMLQMNLDNGLPVLYVGFGSGGHAFVCDGYESTIVGNLYHFNWGYLGDYDGWFALDSLTNGGSSFSSSQVAILNIQPTFCWSNLSFNCDKVFVSGILYQYGAMSIISTNHHEFSIQSGANVHLQAGDEIVLTDGFHAALGSGFHAEITPCEFSGERRNPYVSNISKTEVKSFSTTSLQDGISSINIRPNPAHNSITVTCDSPMQGIVAYNRLGQPVYANANLHGRTEFALDISSWPAGLYLLQLTFPNGEQITRKVVKD